MADHCTALQTPSQGVKRHWNG